MMSVNVWIVLVVALWAISACSSGGGGGDGTRAPDDANTGDGTAGDGDGDGTGTGGGDGDGDVDGDGTAGGGTAGGDGSMELSCPDVGPPQFDPTELPECGIEGCTGARCLPNGLVTAAQVELLAACNDDEVCVPDELILTNGEVLLRECESVDGAEGRCVSTCVPLVAEQADVLPRDVCEDDELCAPCFDPITREATGACSQGCDPGPVDDPYFFPECCGGQSLCVPTELVPEAQRDLLGPDTCDGEGRICAPMDMAADRSAYPDRCESVGGAEGRCLLDCIPDVAAQADRLPRDVCDEGALCAPCTDPITAEDTGACAIGNDPGPEGTPLIFDTCCDAAGMDVGVCVPPSLVPSEQVALLGADTCGGGALCAPRDVATGSYSPQSCTSLADGEGRCLPGCLPDVAAQLDRLPRDVCDDGYYCTPCTDPVTGLSTGACELEGDEPAEAPTTFDECCSDGDGGFRSVCVPTALVPSEQVSLLDTDTCSGDGLLCAPKDIAAGTYAPTSCTGPGGAEARCLPACLPDVADRADQLVQDTCAQGELCVPCFDPFTGETTGACELEDDVPSDPVYTFPTCCSDGGDPASDLGTCVPETLVPAEQLSLLGQDTCDQGSGSFLCAPTDVATGTYSPESCTGPVGAEARCLPACLPDVQARADLLEQDTCTRGELCVPCFDPFTGESTGACELESDMPAEPALIFDTCCDDGTGMNDLGACVPEALVPGEQLSVLGQDTCDQSSGSFLCAPTDVATGDYVPESCTVPYGIEGRCLPACLPDIAAQADFLTQETCSQGELCAPCYDPFTGEDTGACRLEGDSPQASASTFATCCDDGTGTTDLGTCIPSPLVPGEYSSLLGGDVCDQGPGETMCAPTDVATGTYTPEDCDSWGGAEGRCLAACLQPIADRADQLQPPDQDTCGQGELCAPCYDPIDGVSSGSCELEGDAPVEPAFTFPECCSTEGSFRGRCVPSTAAGSAADSLPQTECEGMEPGQSDTSEVWVCAPNQQLTVPATPLAPCTTDCVAGGLECFGAALIGIQIGGQPGACLPACFLSEQDTTLGTADTVYGPGTSCPTGELCAPCIDPQTDEATGVCDPPPEAP